MTAALRRVADVDLQMLLKNIKPCYKHAAKRFIEFLEDNDCSIVDPACWDAWQKELDGIQHTKKMNGKKFSASTYNHYIEAAVERLRYAVNNSEGLTVSQKYQIEQMIKSIKRKRREPPAVEEDKVLSKQEIDKFIAECPVKKVALWFEFLSQTALRVSEMLGILINDMTNGGDYYTIRIRGKGDTERKIKVSAELVGRIRKEFHSTSYLFQSPHIGAYTREYVSMNIKRWGKRILDRSISAHTLRHTWATHALKKTGRIKAVQNFLGHANSSTTVNLYVHDNFNWDEQKELFS